MSNEITLDKITNQYLHSGDFNGLSLLRLDNEFEKIKSLVIDLVFEEKIVINFGDRHPNSHILAFEPQSKNEQLQKLESPGFDPTYCCAYPSKNHLHSIINPNDYSNKPFTLLLALGNPQFSYKAFDLRVLEFYRNDPRYSYITDDIHGYIVAKSDTNLSESDKNFLETFGFAYDKDLKKRYVAVFLIYLSRLTPEHQQRWYLELCGEETFLHPDYYKASIMGSFDLKESIFNAFCEEMRIINEMALKIKNKRLFNDSYSRENKLKKFSFLIRPTKEEYGNFIHLLDKMISDNLNKDFFVGEVKLITLEEKDGRTIQQNKGTLQLLEEWLNKNVNFPNMEPLNKMIAVFRKIRKERSASVAHTIIDDVWDDEYFTQQRKLIIEAYTGIRTLRLILANHPSTKDVKVPEWLFKTEISTF